MAHAVRIAVCLAFAPAWALAARPTASRPATGWIWSDAHALAEAPIETRYFRYEFDLADVPPRAEITIGADNTFKLFVNGIEGASGDNWQRATRQDIAAALKPGRNAIAAVVSNGGGPAWFYLEGEIADGSRRVNLTTGSAWKWSPQPESASWLHGQFNVGKYTGWKPAVVLGDGQLAPHVRAIFDKPEIVGAIPLPVDWKAFRERQRKDLAAATRPADPPGDAAEHPIDRFLKQWWADAAVEPGAQSRGSRTDATAANHSTPVNNPQSAIRNPQAVNDATFARRAYLDITSLPPTETQLQAFLADKDADKRPKLIETLLSDDLAYAQGQMAWWCDLLRNDEQTNIDNLRKPITKWLFAALKENRPYDQMVAELLNPGPGGPDGYLKGINWRGIVNASQRPPVQAAQNVGQVFLATSIKCASCHDHFTKPILLEDSYGLASFFSPTNLEIYRCDKPTGQIAAPEFLIHNTTLAKISPDSDLPARLKAISEMVTSVRDPNFAPAMVNRLWKKLMGRGLFEPVDEISAKCANKPLLDWLAYDFMAHDYDLKHTIKLLMTSRAYQLESISESPDEMRKSDKVAPVYVGPPMRRLTGEQFADAVSHLTGYWPQVKTMDVQVEDQRIRAWRQKVPDALQLALGRPTREQVCTVRMEDASMLQMLEMSNGKVLAERLAEGSKRLIQELGQLDPEKALTVLYLRGIARTPSADEIALLTPMLGRPSESVEARRPGWEDVIWIIAMSPEFQYIQ